MMVKVESAPRTFVKKRGIKLVLFYALIVQAIYLLFTHDLLSTTGSLFGRKHYLSQTHREHLQAKCTSLRTPAGPPASFKPASRLERGNDRWVPGTPPTLLRNAKIWTGARNGTEVVYGDVLLDRGLVVAVGYIPPRLLDTIRGEVLVKDVGGKWITPGLVDLHSHIGVYSSPALSGTSDGNSRKAPILPWLRSIDGLNTHDASYELARAGGVTTAQILPGSANNIGGQAFVIKLRDTLERSPTSFIVEPPSTLTHPVNETEYIHWRHMKHACGENPDRLYGQSRMDAQWNFRQAYNEARQIRDIQDAFCAKVDSQDWEGLSEEYEGAAEVPEEMQWESLVDVLRGKVKLSIHCYEAVDLDGIVRLSNEFKFPVASFHHAGETYLVPDLLKKTWGGAPSIALFASNFKKKREAYRSSEFAPAILAEHGIPVVMKSDHPVINSRYLLFEAQQAHYYGLSPSLALASVTSVPARAAGLGHRVGTIAEGYDADLAIWDSHPLSLGATPEQVYIDGIPQLEDPQVLEKSDVLQHLPKVPDWEKEKRETVKWDGVPPLVGWKQEGDKGKGKRKVKLENVRSLVVYQPTEHGQTEFMNENGEEEGEYELKTVFDVDDSLIAGTGLSVLIEDGKIICIKNTSNACTFPSPADSKSDEEVIDLKGGSLAPGLTTYGSPLGLVEIRFEPSTNDGPVGDPLYGDLPKVLEDAGVVRAVDGLLFGGRNTLLAYKSGVTTAITAPVGGGFTRGLSTAFSVGAPHALSRGAVQQEEAALHVGMSFTFGVSVSTQVEVLRKALFEDDSDLKKRKERDAWARVREGRIPVVISVDNADIMASLIHLKAEYDAQTRRKLRLTFSGGTEAHLLAKEIAEAGISVILTSPRPYPGLWEQRRILPGPPLSKESSITTLIKAGVNVAIGVDNESSARNTRFELAWVSLEANGTLHRNEVLALATKNLHSALGLSRRGRKSVVPDLVMYSGGGVLSLESKVVGVVSAARGSVELF